MASLAEPRPVLRGLRLPLGRIARHRRGSGTPHSYLAEPRPVLRGLRPLRRWTGHGSARSGRNLAEPRPVLRGLRRGDPPPGRCTDLNALQSRDPFSGDCDAVPTGRRRLPVAQDWQPARLAEPRPVLRGLRRWAGWRPGCRRFNSLRAPCRAETRSQGIATQGAAVRAPAAGPDPLAEPRPVLRGLRQDVKCRAPRSACRLLSCRAETRSQGIATEIRPGSAGRHRGTPGASPLQSRDPFSGDCDFAARAGAKALQSRDPFSGDCDPPLLSLRPVYAYNYPCRAETRSQGIAT
jgi:hypothetical protein